MKITIFINDKKQESFWLTPVREEYLKHLLKYNIPLREIFESVDAAYVGAGERPIDLISLMTYKVAGNADYDTPICGKPIRGGRSSSMTSRRRP